MIIPGLCSVTFRDCAVERIAAMVREHELGAIEWGADVHVPPGDLDAARRARSVSEGLEVTYGSYLFAGGADVGDDEIVAVIDTAAAIGAGTIRVWTPFGVTEADTRRSDVVAALRRAAALAEQRGAVLALEFHGGTLTETVTSTQALLDDVDAANLLTYWQPPYWISERTIGDDVADVLLLGPHLANLHVYEWTATPTVARRPLAEGAERWRAVFDAVATVARPAGLAGPRAAFLEFVAADDPANFPADAATLRNEVRR